MPALPRIHRTEGKCHVGENFCLEDFIFGRPLGRSCRAAVEPQGTGKREAASSNRATCCQDKIFIDVSGAAETSTSRREPTEAQLAARERRVKCGAEWRAAKEKGSVEEGATWPKYWSACNKRLKEQGA
jgi:hypothetical protein